MNTTVIVCGPVENPASIQVLAALFKAFQPRVEAAIKPLIDEINSRRLDSVHYKPSDLVTAGYETAYGRLMPEVDGILLYLTVELGGGPVYLPELNSIEAALETFCCDETQPLSLNGYGWVLGDGDDEMAVTFQNGKFCIWLRGWKPEVVV